MIDRNVKSNVLKFEVRVVVIRLLISGRQVGRGGWCVFVVPWSIKKISSDEMKGIKLNGEMETVKRRE